MKHDFPEIIITLKPVYVAEKDYEEANRIEHLTKDQIKVKLFQIMDTLPTAEGALQQEKFQKLVKNCPKSKYIEFFLWNLWPATRLSCWRGWNRTIWTDR